MNQNLILYLLEYVGNARTLADTRLVDMVCKLLRLMMMNEKNRKIFDFTRGFPDLEIAR
jgi:hypothetical protein